MGREIFRRDEHRNFRVRLVLVVLLVSDPVFPRRNSFEPHDVHVEAVLRQSESQEVVVGADPERTEGVVAVHPEQQTRDQHVQPEKCAPGEEADGPCKSNRENQKLDFDCAKDYEIVEQILDRSSLRGALVLIVLIF
jgi:hypothetical protein